jgi:demethylmenaquinone methyltransferase/2-methoxy-6-polyprenyl-1,4-benzoquinol methylase
MGQVSYCFWRWALPIFDHFELLAPVYDRFIPPRDGQALLDLARLPTGGRLLDAAGGTGRIATILEGQAAQRVVADASLGMLRRAAEKDGLHPACAYAEALPFPDSCFERVVMVDSLHHVSDQQHSANELWRVLKPGGILLIEEPDIRTIAAKLVALVEKLTFMRSRFLSPAQIAALFPYPEAQIRVEQGSFNTWVQIAKSA